MQFLDGVAMGVSVELITPGASRYAVTSRDSMEAWASDIAEDYPPDQSTDSRMVWEAGDLILSVEWVKGQILYLDTVRFAESQSS